MTFANLGLAVTSNADKAAIDLDKLVAASARAEAGAKRLSTSSDTATAALRREAAAMDELADGLQRTATNGGYLTANLAQQAQDVVIAAQMGQSAIQVGLQQGMQAASVIQMLRSQGLSTGGALAAALGSLISPVNLLTIGLVSLGAVGIQALVALAPEAESATDAIERHRDALDDIVEGYDAAGEAVDNYIRNAERLPRALAQDEITRQFAEIRREADDFRQQMERFGANQLFSKYGSEAVLTLQGLAREFAAGELPADAFYSAVGKVSSQLNLLERAGAAIPGSTQSMIDSFREGALKAIAFGSAIDQLVASSHALAGLSGGDWTEVVLKDRLESDRSAASHQIELDALKAKTPAQMRDIAMRRERLKLADEEISEALREQKVREAGELAFARAQANASKTATKDFDQWGSSKASFQLRIDQAQSEIELYGKSTFEIERQKATLDLLADAKRAGIPITASLTDEISSMAESYAETQVRLQALQMDMENASPWDKLATKIERINELMKEGGLSAQGAAVEVAKAVEQMVTAYTSAAAGILGSFDKFEDARAMQAGEALAQQQDYINSLDRTMEGRLDNLYAMMQAGTISSQEYASEVARITEETGAAREAAGKSYADSVEAEGKRAFEAEKALSIARAVLSGGEAIAKSYSWGTTLGGPIGGAIAAGLAAAATAAQIAAIAGTSYHSKAPVNATSGGGGSAASAAGSQGSQSIYLNISGRGSIGVDELVEQMTKQIADGGHGGLIKVIRAA